MAASYSRANLETAENYELSAMAAGFILGGLFTLSATLYYGRHYRTHALASPTHPIFFGMGCMVTFTITLMNTVEALAHTYFGILPNTCDAMIELAGRLRAKRSYPCQRDLLISWFNQDHLNLGELLKIHKIDSILPFFGIFSAFIAICIVERQVKKRNMNRPIRLGDEKVTRELEAQKSIWGVCPHCSHGFVVPVEDDV